MLRAIIVIGFFTLLATACAMPATVAPSAGPPATMPPAAPAPAGTASPAPSQVAAVSTAPAAAAAQAGGAAAIVLTRSGGFAGRTERWTLYGDGRLASSQGLRQAATPDQVTALLTEVQSLGFFKLNDEYGAMSQCRDCYNYEMTVNAGGSSKTVRWVGEAADAPPALGQIMAKFNALVASAK